jgi:transcriptional regulator with XRE-family HTH domain
MDSKDSASRIRLFREKLSLSQSAFALGLGIPRTSLINYEKGTSVPAEVLSLLYEKYDLSLAWFLTGEGQMSNSFPFGGEGGDNTVAEADSKFATVANLPPAEAHVLPEATAVDDGPLGIPIMRSGLSAGTLAALEAGISGPGPEGARLNGARSLEMSGGAEDDDKVYVDFYTGQSAGAGPAQDVEVYQPVTPKEILRKFINPWRPDQVRALEVRGDSMTKIGLFDRDIVLFVPSEREGDGVFVISIESRMQVKRLEFDLLGKTMRIISENDRYEPRILTSEDEIARVRIEGKVVGWLHRHPY